MEVKHIMLEHLTTEGANLQSDFFLFIMIVPDPDLTLKTDPWYKMASWLWKLLIISKSGSLG